MILLTEKSVTLPLKTSGALRDLLSVPRLRYYLVFMLLGSVPSTALSTEEESNCINRPSPPHAVSGAFEKLREQQIRGHTEAGLWAVWGRCLDTWFTHIGFGGDGNQSCVVLGRPLHL